jgi:hypothetical protein
MHHDNAPSTANLEIDIAGAERFLRLLDSTATQFEFRTFDDNKQRKDPGLTRTFFGALTRHAATLQRLNQKGAGVFVTVNQTDGKGRATENITRVRAAYIDLDGPPLDAVRAAKFKPHIIVSSSPHKWHVYWLVHGMALENFTPVQERLIKVFDSDPKVKALAGVMRLPGFYHCKAEPFLVHIIESLDTPPYPASLFKVAERPPRERRDDTLRSIPTRPLLHWRRCPMTMPTRRCGTKIWRPRMLQVLAAMQSVTLLGAGRRNPSSIRTANAFGNVGGLLIASHHARLLRPRSTAMPMKLRPAGAIDGWKK